MPKRGENIYKRRDGRWEGRYHKIDPVTGIARQASVYGKTYAEVKEKLLQHRQQTQPPNTAHPEETRNLTVGDILLLWLAERQPRIKPSSYTRYHTLAHKHLIPALGDIALTELTAPKISAFVEQKISPGRSGSLSPKTVSDILSVLRSALKIAARRYYLPNLNGISDIKAPVYRQRRIDTFSDNEVKSITRKVLQAPTSDNLAILLCLNTGLRLGELCALRWEDIDFAEQTLTVRQNVQRLTQNGKSELVIQTPKSETSRRVIPLTTEILSLLRTHCSRSTYVFGGSLPLEPRTMQYRFKSFLKKNGLKVRNFHALRHSFATRCIAMGADVKTLSELLGHSNIKTTMQLYVHPTMEQKRANMQLVSTLNDCA